MSRQVLEVRVPLRHWRSEGRRESPEQIDHLKRKACVEVGLRMIEFLLERPGTPVAFQASESRETFDGDGGPLVSWGCRVEVGEVEIVQRLEPAEEVGDTALGILRLNLEHGGRGVELLPVVRDLMAERAFRKVAGAAGRQRLEVLVRDLLRGCASWHHGRGFPLGAEVGDLQMALEALEREVGHAKR